jgi:hypothetical protein
VILETLAHLALRATLVTKARKERLAHQEQPEPKVTKVILETKAHKVIRVQMDSLHIRLLRLKALLGPKKSGLQV